MSRIIAIYMTATHLFGINNLRLDFAHCKCELNHKPTIIYCLVVNGIIFALWPFAVIELIRAYYDCEKLDVILFMHNITRTANSIAYFIAVLGTWYRRGKVQRIVIFYMRLLRKYQNEYFANARNAKNLREARILVGAKIGTSLCRIIFLFAYIYGSHSSDGSANNICNGGKGDGSGDNDGSAGDNVVDDNVEVTSALTFLLVTLYLCLCESQMVLIDCNIFFGLLFAKVLLGFMLQQLSAIFREVQLMHKVEERRRRRRRHGSFGRPAADLDEQHRLWRSKLARAIRSICKRQRLLRLAINDYCGMIEILLISFIACTFLNLILMFFKILVVLADSQNLNIFNILFNFFIAFAYFGNSFLLFYVCEQIRASFMLMRQLVFKISMHVTPYGWQSGSNNMTGRQLELSIDYFSLELRQGQCRLNICGFFNLSIHTSAQMMNSIALHLLFLVQVAIQQL